MNTIISTTSMTIVTAIVAVCLLSLEGLCSMGQAVNGAERQDGFVFVILSQPNQKHFAVAQDLADDIAVQATQLSLRYHIHQAEVNWPGVATWTYFPLLERVKYHHEENSTWIIILEEWSQIRLCNLINILRKYESTEKIFLGHGLNDATETIIHHYDLVNEDQPFFFPDTRAGLVLSTVLVLSLAKRWSDVSLRPTMDFTIDAKYEFARFIESDGTLLIHQEEFCLEDRISCAVTFSLGAKCETHLKAEDIHFAIKTYSKFHEERLPIVKGTWLKDAPNFAFYSEIEDLSIGTVSLGIPNTERGHCGKTMAIIRHTAQLPSLRWLAVVDDDTLLSVPRLLSLLSCYDSEDMIAVGEKYGFHPISPYGYDYITGGGGMIFSAPLVKRLAEPGIGECPTNDTPDDMFLGMHLRRLSVPIIHSRAFHQGRPMDYPEKLLNHELPVSFHKYWMMDPYEAYSQWLDVAIEDSHDEL